MNPMFGSGKRDICIEAARQASTGGLLSENPTPRMHLLGSRAGRYGHDLFFFIRIGMWRAGGGMSAGITVLRRSAAPLSPDGPATFFISFNALRKRPQIFEENRVSKLLTLCGGARTGEIHNRLNNICIPMLA